MQIPEPSAAGSEDIDVVIIGGGPAGSTAATLLAKAGHRVVVLEREKFPRFHIGESLLPLSLSTFQRLGLDEKLTEAGFLDKFGAEISTATGENQVQFFFRNAYKAKHPQSFQVLRSEFDTLLLRHAEDCGAEVREGTEVISFQPASMGNAPVIELRDLKTSKTETLRPAWVLDCSGRQSVVGTASKSKQRYHDLKKFSVYAHYQGAYRPDGPEGTFTRMIRGEDYWFWMIPLAGDRISVGAVCDAAAFKASGRSPEAFFEDLAAATPEVASWLKCAERVTPVYAAGDYSYRNDRLAGDRWILAGDAAGFIDPVFSSGVFMALHSGEKAADALIKILANPENPRVAQTETLAYERDVNRVMDIYLRFVRAWYRPEFIEIFVNPVQVFQIAPAVNAVLAGNLGKDIGVRWRVELFYLAVYCQRFFPLCPRLSLSSIAKALATKPELAEC